MINKDFFLSDSSELNDMAERLFEDVDVSFGFTPASGFIQPKQVVDKVQKDISAIEFRWTREVLTSKTVYNGRKSSTRHIMSKGPSKCNIAFFMKKKFGFDLCYDKETRMHSRLAYSNKFFKEICFMELAYLMYKYWHYTTRYEFVTACISALVEYFDIYTSNLYSNVSKWNICSGDVRTVIEEVLNAPMSITREYLDLIDPNFNPEYEIVRVTCKDIFNDGEVSMMIHDGFAKSEIIEKIMDKCGCKRTKAYDILRTMGEQRKYSGKGLTQQQLNEIASKITFGASKAEIVQYIMKKLDCSRRKAYRLMKEHNITRPYGNNLSEEEEKEIIDRMIQMSVSVDDVMNFIKERISSESKEVIKKIYRELIKKCLFGADKKVKDFDSIGFLSVYKIPFL